MTRPHPLRGKALIDASRPFAQEDRARSRFHVATTLGALVAVTAVAAAAPWWPVRAAAAVMEALLLLRAFILYHDAMHGSLLRDSPSGMLLMRVLGVLLLSPPRVWTDTHNAHHANTARLAALPTGTYSLWTVERWRRASRVERLKYRLERHPVTMLFGYFTVFMFAMCIAPFAENPRRYASSGVAAVLHVGISVAVWSVLGPAAYFAAVLAPLSISCAIGCYLFYVQHNAPGVELRHEDEWSHDDGAVAGSTHLAMGSVMRWSTGNIGFHHVHHLNARIPFYRLPETMAALPELQQPVRTTLRPRDVLECLRLALWDPERNRMIGFTDVRDPVHEREIVRASV